jgi:cytochrome c biogenesis protein CcdA
MDEFNRTTAVGVFHERRQAENAVDELSRAGFRHDQIGVAARSDQPDYDGVATDTGTRAGEGAAAGAITGGAFGTLAGLAVAAGMIPAIGPVLAGGILAGLVASAAVGAAAGGIVGALIGMGIPEEEAGYYGSEFEAGRTIVTVRADGRYGEAVAILRRCGAYDVSNRELVGVGPMDGLP